MAFSRPIYLPAQLCKTMNITVAIVEDQREIREMLAILVNGSDGYACVGAYGTAEEAIAALPELSPDVALIDIHLPQQSGIDCIRQLKGLCPSTSFMMCTSLEDAATIFDALRAGASGYLVKGTGPAKILEAIRDVHEGGAPMSSAIARKVVNSFEQTSTRQSSELAKLTAREQEILMLLSRGYRYKEIAGQLEIGLETVRKHIHNIYEKLQVASRTDALNKII